MALSCCKANTVSFINKEGVELFQIGKDKTGSITYNTVFIKDNNSVAASSGDGDNRCILIIDMGGDRLVTIIWACLSFSLTKFISQGFDSTTTSPNF
jgi:hypothetical protein